MGEHGRTEADVAIIGAGLAGLTAARDLAAGGAEVVVLEARDRVGGRTLGQPIGDGDVVDMGGEYYGPLATKIAALALEVGVEGVPNNDEGDKLTEVDGRVSRYRGFLPRVNLLTLLDCAQAVARFERMVQQVPPEAPWTAPKAIEWDSQTLWSWMQRNFRTKAGREIFEMGTEAIWCGAPADFSLLHALFYSRSYGSFQFLGSVKKGSQESRFANGAQSISQRLAAPLGDRVVLEAAVRRVEHHGDRVRLTGPGVDVTAREAIVALPPVLASRLEYDPPLPGYRDQLSQRLPAGSVIKYLAVYDRPFWRDAGLSGQATSYTGPARVVFDSSPRSVNKGVLGAFVSGRPARELAQLPEAHRRALVLEGLCRLYGDRALRPVEVYEKDWMADPWTRGCYNALAGTGALTSFGPALRAPIGRIHWAGSETAVHANGSLGGAVDSGERAAAEVLAALAGEARPAEAAEAAAAAAVAV